VEIWIQQYGYLAIFLGTFLEGETILILAGFAAHRGYLQLHWVIAAAFLGTLLGDQLFFFLGRRHQEFLLRWKPHWKPRLERVRRLIENYQVLIILGFRFLYGLRTITPFGLGMSRVPGRLFIPLNLVGALIWATIFGVAGYLFGQALEAVLGDIKRYEIAILLILLLGGALGWGIYLWRNRRERTGRRAE